jgi:hypothetical protein
MNVTANALSNAAACFFHIFVIVLLAEREKSGQLCLKEHRH